MDKGLGRRQPPDFEHVEKYRATAVLPETITTVNKTFRLPQWHWDWDQGAEGACVGFGTSMMLSIINEDQARRNKKSPITHRYDPRWLWDRAKELDPWSDTNPGDDNGTSVNAGCQALRKLGHVRVLKSKNQAPDLSEGISAYRWATKVDEMRTCIAQGLPISIGVDWYSNFDQPQRVGTDYYIGKGPLGRIRGGHCICIYGASDTHQAFRVKNSWGREYPLVWLPYETMQKLLDDSGEACIVTDR
jgi:hypothetical protein